MKNFQTDYSINSGLCNLCPRNCNVLRSQNNRGYCGGSTSYDIGSICVHKGEEPVISGAHGICNIFFSLCNLRCIYCQNYQISRPVENFEGTFFTLESIVETVIGHLNNGCTHVGFVSPSHMIKQVMAIIQALRQANQKPVFVYNSNGYDSVNALKQLEGLIDVYLPDFKYMDTSLAEQYSGAADYPEMASAAIREMYRQKGSTLILDDMGNAISGLIIRHLVLPGHVDNSKAVLRHIAEELSPLIHISLMSQYYPTPAVAGHPFLNRKITLAEYHEVIDEMESLGMYRGWTQEPESYDHYLPDFNLEHPFE